MTELQLYKFIHFTSSEYHWTNDDSDVFLFINIRNLEEWNNLLGSGITDEYGIKCVMKEGYFCFEMQDICNYFNIDINEIFNKES